MAEYEKLEVLVLLDFEDSALTLESQSIKMASAVTDKTQ